MCGGRDEDNLVVLDSVECLLQESGARRRGQPGRAGANSGRLWAIPMGDAQATQRAAENEDSLGHGYKRDWEEQRG